MATQSKVVIYNPITKKHEPIAAGDTLAASILPPSAGSSRKLWIGKVDYNVVYIAQGSDYGPPPDLVVGEKYLVWKYAPTDDFSNVGHGSDESIVFTATGTTPAVWTNSVVHHVVEDVTVTEHYNTIGFVVAAELRINGGSMSTLLTTSAPYWLNPLAIYNDGSILPIDATKASAYASTAKLVLELI